MAQRLIFLLPLLFLCTTNVLGDSNNEGDPEYPFSQNLKVVSNNGASRNLMQDIVTRLSKYFNKEHNLGLTTSPVPAPGPSHHLISPSPIPGPGPSPSPRPSPIHPLDCDGLCKNRCSLHSRPNVCWRACGTCCVRCKCVPPGTFGNRELCGTCYTNMTTHGNRPKCP